MRAAISVTGPAEDLRQLQSGEHGPRSGGRYHLQAQPVEWALGPSDQPVRDLGVARRGRQVGVTEQDLDDPDVGAVLQQVRGEAVPERVHRRPSSEEHTSELQTLMRISYAVFC